MGGGPRPSGGAGGPHRPLNGGLLAAGATHQNKSFLIETLGTESSVQGQSGGQIATHRAPFATLMFGDAFTQCPASYYLEENAAASFPNCQLRAGQAHTRVMLTRRSLQKAEEGRSAAATAPLVSKQSAHEEGRRLTGATRHPRTDPPS